MSTVTTNQGITIPVGTDGADNPAAFLAFVAGVESRLVQRFTTLADRTTRNPIPVEGQYADLAAENRTDAYDGASYISATARGRYARRMRTSNAAAINNSIALVSDATLTVPLDVTGLFTFRGRIYYDAAAAADIRLAFTFPTVAASGAKWGMIAHNATTYASFDTLVATASGSALIAGANGVATNAFLDFDGFINTTATGNLVAQYAQGTADISNLTVQFGSYLDVIKEG